MKKVHKPYHRFKNWLRENKIPYRELSEFLGVTIPTISEKINGNSDFFLSEVQAIREKYKLPAEYFFTEDVA